MESITEKEESPETLQALIRLLRGDPRLTNLLVIILILCQTGLVSF